MEGKRGTVQRPGGAGPGAEVRHWPWGWGGGGVAWRACCACLMASIPLWVWLHAWAPSLADDRGCVCPLARRPAPARVHACQPAIPRQTIFALSVSVPMHLHGRPGGQGALPAAPGTCPGLDSSDQCLDTRTVHPCTASYPTHPHLPSSVLTTPGCSALTVTALPGPSRRTASYVNSTLASLD